MTGQHGDDSHESARLFTGVPKPDPELFSLFLSPDSTMQGDESSSSQGTKDVFQFRLFVSKLPSNTSEEEIRQQFSQFGNIVLIRFPQSNNKATTSSCYISFDDAKSIYLALAQETHYAPSNMSTPIVVTEALPRGVRAHEDDTADTKLKRRVFVRGVGNNITENDLTQYFTRWGCVEAVKIHTDRPGASSSFSSSSSSSTSVDGSSPGRFAFVTYSSLASMFKLLADDTTSHAIQGESITVTRAKPPKGALQTQGGGGPFFVPLQQQQQRMLVQQPQRMLMLQDMEPEHRLFVPKLPADITKYELAQIFGGFGSIKAIKVKQSSSSASSSSPSSSSSSSPSTPSSTSYAYISYHTSTEMHRAIASDSGKVTVRGVLTDIVEAEPFRLPGHNGGTHQTNHGGGSGSGSSKDERPFRVFVSKIPSALADSDVRQYFSQFGTLVDYYKPKNQGALKAGVERAHYFGYVIFTNAIDVSKVLCVEEHTINNVKVTVTKARAYADDKHQQQQHQQQQHQHQHQLQHQAYGGGGGNMGQLQHLGHGNAMHSKQTYTDYFMRDGSNGNGNGNVGSGYRGQASRGRGNTNTNYNTTNRQGRF